MWGSRYLSRHTTFQQCVTTPITGARTRLLLLSDLFYPSGDVEEGPIHLTNHRASNVQYYSLQYEHFVVKSVEFV